MTEATNNNAALNVILTSPRTLTRATVQIAERTCETYSC